jgi:hypothetical protein
MKTARIAFATLFTCLLFAPAPGNTQSPVGFDIDVDATFTGATPGAKLTACLAAVDAGSYPSGSICDMRGMIKESQPLNLGPNPIEIGRVKPAWVLWPNSGTANLNTTATYLATPAAPTVSTSTSGSLPAGSYYIKINYRTGDGVSASSAEVSTTLTSAGSFTVTGPATCPQYTSAYDVTASSTSGGELLQGNVICGTSFTKNTALFIASPAAPTVATPLPGIILHNNKSGMYADFGAASMYQIQSGGATVSDLVATTGNGYSSMRHLFFYNNLGSAQTTFYDVGAYINSVRDHLQIESTVNGIVYKITGQFNDVDFQSLSLACFSPATNCSLLGIYSGFGNSGDNEGIHSLNFNDGAFVASTGNNIAPAVIIQGKSSAGLAPGSAISGGINTINFNGTSLELGAQPVGVQVTDTYGVQFNGINATKVSTGGTFATLTSTGTYGSTAPTAGYLALMNQSYVSGFANIAQNNITGVTTPMSTTSPFVNDFRYYGGANAHAGYSAQWTSVPVALDSASPISTLSTISASPSTPAVVTTTATFIGTTISGSNSVTTAALPADGSLVAGEYLAGGGIPADATIVSVTGTAGSSGTIVISANAVSSTTATMTPIRSIANTASLGSLVTRGSFLQMASSSGPHTQYSNWFPTVTPTSISAPDPGDLFLIKEVTTDAGGGTITTTDFSQHNAGIQVTNFWGLYQRTAAASASLPKAAPGLIFYHNVFSGGASTPTPGCALAPSVTQNTSAVASLSITCPTGGALSLPGVQSPVATKTAAYTLQASDLTILCDATSGAVTQTLPSTVTTNLFHIKKIDSSGNACTVSGNGHNIDGSSTFVLSSQYADVQIQGDGAQWWKIN